MPLISKYMGIPFVVDLYLPYFTFDGTKKSWRWIIKMQKRLILEVIKKITKKVPYNKK